MGNYPALSKIDCSVLRGLHIAVLKGGSGPERSVSLVSGAAVTNALRSRKHHVTEVDVINENLVLPKNTDLVFNMIHGIFGEDGAVQTILEQQGIPFTGEGSEGSRLAFDKILTKRKLVEANVPTAPFEVLLPGQRPSIAPPFVLKTPRQGSTIGVHIVQEWSQMAAAMEDCLKYGNEILLEVFFPGKELTISIIADIPLPIVEIVPAGGIYGYENKYTPGKTTYFTPARIGSAQTILLQKMALAAHQALGLQIYSRVDILFNAAEAAAVLEVNTIPGMTPTSLLPQAAAAIGLDFPTLCEIIGALSLRRSLKT